MRPLALLLLLAFTPVTAFAQTNDVSLLLGGVEFDTTEIAAFAPADFEAGLEFEEGGALQIGFNHFWRDSFSTEFALIGMGAEPTLRVSEGPADLSIDLGSAGFGAFTASGLFHFRRSARVSPYIGGGIALIGGEIEIEDIEDEEGNPIRETVELEGEGSIVIQAGINIQINNRWAIVIDAKAIPYTAEIEEEDLPEGESIDEIDLNPFLIGFGARYRF